MAILNYFPLLFVFITTLKFHRCNNSAIVPDWIRYGQGGITPCFSKSPINSSENVCGDLCTKEAFCSKESGACICQKEPTPTSLGGHFTHCTNWNYVDQTECKEMCQRERKNDSRVCWTFTVGKYCTCF